MFQPFTILAAASCEVPTACYSSKVLLPVNFCFLESAHLRDRLLLPPVMWLLLPPVKWPLLPSVKWSSLPPINWLLLPAVDQPPQVGDMLAAS